MMYKPFQAGRASASPERECSGDFDERVCGWCDDYDKCKQTEQDFIDDFEKLAYDDELHEDV